MVQYVPDPDLTHAQLVEDLGRDIADLYSDIEFRLLTELRRRVARGLEVFPSMTERLNTIRQLEAFSREALQGVDAQQLADRIIDIATAQGTQAAAAMLGAADHLPRASGFGLAPASVNAAIALRLDLTNKLEALNQRILRFDSDAYQRMVSLISPDVLTGTSTLQVTQRAIVQRFLNEGITGFVDKADRNWRIGSYAEMATRTATQRAWQDAAVAQMQASGVSLVSIIASLSACSRCRPWAGLVLSSDGTLGDVTVPDARTGAPTVIHIDGTLQQARDGGWGHPNDKCSVVGYLPGVTQLQDPSTLDPAMEKAQDRLRALERQVRQSKRDAATALDPRARAEALADVKATQAQIRKHVATTGVSRRSYREQLGFADGGTENPRGRGTPKPSPSQARSVPDSFAAGMSKPSTYARPDVTSLRAAGAVVEDGSTFSKAERAISTWLSGAGHPVWAVRRSDTEKRPDAILARSGQTLEMKTSESGNTKTILTQIRTARRQAGRIVIDVRGAKTPVSEKSARDIAAQAMQRYTDIDGLLIIGDGFAVGLP
ncbi:phage minor capsid protein [Gryllotalpicola koreensis]|uniref:tRNA nuclease CdiA C-terminal domain-containing protein n=1 Tax=Gryllotalpicola koreensis TaxID=993086 RepID=A0ABP8A2Y9_9MICO